MEPGLRQVLALAQGPIFRFAFALMLFGLLRGALLALLNAVASTERGPALRSKIFARIAWQIFPPLLFGRLRRAGLPALGGYHWFLAIVALVFHLGIVIVPTFMVVHVYLWEHAWHIAWPSFAPQVADALSIVTVLAGFVLFLGQLYSSYLRHHEPAWAFFKPLILLLPFLSGLLSMHPDWCPVDYYVVMAVHTLSAAIAFACVPFLRLLSAVHTPLAELAPEYGWVLNGSTPTAGALEVVR